MAFIITEQLIRTYQEGIDAIINQLGKKTVLVMPQDDTVCPNCYYDGRNQRSNGRYKSNNPNPPGALNKPFSLGQVCPVCQGRGKISLNGKETIELVATVKWGPKDFVYTNRGQTIIPTDICKIKTFATYAEDFKNAVEIHVAAEEPVEGEPELTKCALYKNIVPRGLKYSRYFEAYLKKVND